MFYSEISLPVDGVRLIGDLSMPEGAKSLIIFSHGSGSSRLSPRNQQVASYLQKRGIATLLFDLLTPEEDIEEANRFDIRLLTKRLCEVTKILEELSTTKGIALGFFGASTGAASALDAAAKLPQVFAVVSRGGRPDLASTDLSKIKVPVKLIVGSKDTTVLALNRLVFDKLRCKKELAIVPGATHLFEEDGSMEKVANLAYNWFNTHVPLTPKSK
jgi:putative phosphoribosyl transferase